MKKGSFSWYDLSTTDTASAEKYYREVVGWDTKPAPGGDRPYTLVSMGPANVGGIAALTAESVAQGVKPGWTGYILVDDVDAHAQKVKAAGGSVAREPADIPGVLRFAVVADPHGAPFIIFKGYSNEPGVELAPTDRGNVGWNELHAGDGARDFEFYARLFGWTGVQALDMGALGTYQTFATGGGAIGGVMNKTPNTPAPSWLFYFNVEGIDAAAARVNGAGGKVLMGPHQVPDGRWILNCTDPQGAVFGLLSPGR